MKKTISLFLCAMALISLMGCSEKDVTVSTAIQTTVPDITATESPATEPITQPDQRPMVALSLPVNILRNAIGNVKLFEHIYQEMDVVLPEPDIAERIIIDFLNRTDTAETAEKISGWANEDYDENYPDWIRYLCQATYEPMRIDEAVLSLYGTHVEFGGINLSQNFNDAVTYDMTTGNVIPLTTVLTNISRDELCELLTEQLAQQKDTLSLFDDFADTIRDRFSGSLADEKDWYFTETGLCFFFTPYEIAPYASGTVTAQIPYHALAGRMNDAYFPPEQDQTLGNIALIDFSAENANRFNQFAELTLPYGNRNMLLYTDLSVTDVRIEYLESAQDSASLDSSYTIFAAPHLTPGDAVKIEFSNEDLKNLRLRYTSSGKIHYAYFTLQNDNHTVTLND